MALDEGGRRLFIGCRKPAAVVILDTESGQQLASVPIRGDVDDVFYDAKRKRLYASCGQGFLAVFREAEVNRFEVLKEIPTMRLARTCLLELEMGRLLPGDGPPGQAGWVLPVNRVPINLPVRLANYSV
jgi:hypothetical protein